MLVLLPGCGDASEISSGNNGGSTDGEKTQGASIQGTDDQDGSDNQDGTDNTDNRNNADGGDNAENRDSTDTSTEHIVSGVTKKTLKGSLGPILRLARLPI